MRRIDNIYRTHDHAAMFFVIRDTDARESEVWFYPADGRLPNHVRTFTHARDAAAKASMLADELPRLSSSTAWNTAVMS